MILTLNRFSKSDAGIFSHLFDEQKDLVAVTLEHAYESEPKIPNGTLKCVRGMHRLHPDSPAFETFEITGVGGHSGLLFHCGNFAYESQGCVLLGTALDGNMVTESRKAFDKFMALVGDLEEFDLVVC